MPLDFDRLSRWTFDEIRHSYGTKDTILYALGVGAGERREDLRFVYEKDLVALPSMATILGDPGFWLTDQRLGAGYESAVHGEQSIELHEPLPASGTVLARNAIERVVDKGPGKGVFIHGTRRLYDEAGSRLLVTMTWIIILRGDGGASGQAAAPRERAVETPRSAAPAVATNHSEIAIRTLPQAAMIYRLSGDWNPLHVDPGAAARAGFDRPILHGLCSLGVATRAVLQSCCDNDPARLRSFSVRFSAPVFPGETIVTNLWRNGADVGFRCSVAERPGTIVLDAGRAEVRQ